MTLGLATPKANCLRNFAVEKVCLIWSSSTIDKKLENFEFIFEFKIAINFEFNFEIFVNFEFNFEIFVNFEFFSSFLSISSFFSVPDEVTINIFCIFNFCRKKKAC